MSTPTDLLTIQEAKSALSKVVADFKQNLANKQAEQDSELKIRREQNYLQELEKLTEDTKRQLDENEAKSIRGFLKESAAKSILSHHSMRVAFLKITFQQD